MQVVCKEFALDVHLHSNYLGQHQSQWILMEDAALDKVLNLQFFKFL